jgi:four helix bundle protein
LPKGAVAMARGDDIHARLIDFAVVIINLCNAIPKTPSGRHIAGQLLRCGTSPAPNYGEARGAESRNDFIHKLGIVLKELNESFIWLEMIKRSQILPIEKLSPAIGECCELARIINASIKTAGRKN